MRGSARRRRRPTADIHPVGAGAFPADDKRPLAPPPSLALEVQETHVPNGPSADSGGGGKGIRLRCGKEGGRTGSSVVPSFRSKDPSGRGLTMAPSGCISRPSMSWTDPSGMCTVLLGICTIPLGSHTATWGTERNSALESLRTSL